MVCELKLDNILQSGLLLVLQMSVSLQWLLSGALQEADTSDGFL